MDLKTLLKIVRKKLWLVITLPFAAASIIACFIWFNYVPLYEARTTLYVMDDNVSRQAPAMQTQLELAMALVNDYRELVKSRLITSDIIKQLNLKGLDPDKLSRKITVNARQGTRVIVISVTDEDPVVARDIANKAGEVFSQKAIELMRADSVSTIEKASAPAAPVNSKSYPSVVLAFFSGIVLAVGIITFIHYMNDTIISQEDIERYLGLQVLGTIPSFSIK